MTIRIVVTGSRHWTESPGSNESNIIRNKLTQAVYMSTELTMGFSFHDRVTIEGDVVIVHGGARGADAVADACARESGWRVEVFEADWAVPPRKHDRAGPERNARMLDAGANLVLAFPFGDRRTSPGTWNCIDLAAVRGIPIGIFPKAKR